MEWNVFEKIAAASVTTGLGGGIYQGLMGRKDFLKYSINLACATGVVSGVFFATRYAFVPDNSKIKAKHNIAAGFFTGFFMAGTILGRKHALPGAAFGTLAGLSLTGLDVITTVSLRKLRSPARQDQNDQPEEPVKTESWFKIPTWLPIQKLDDDEIERKKQEQLAIEIQIEEELRRQKLEEKTHETP